MSKIDHKNFLTTTGEFAERAAAAASLAELQEWFEKALLCERVAAYRCQGGRGIDSRGDQHTESVAPFGVPVSMAVDALDGHTVTVTMWASADPDPLTMSRLHLLAVLYVTHAVVLAEVDGVCAAADGGAAIARQCVALAASGLSHIEIGERFGLSPQAVGIQLRRAVKEKPDASMSH